MIPEAVKLFEAVIALDPSHHEAHIRLVIALMSIKRYERAIDVLVMAFNGDLSEAAHEAIQLGVQLEEKKGDRDSAMEFYAAAVKKNVLRNVYQRPPGILNPLIPSQPFWDARLFRWVELLEKNYEAIKREFLNINKRLKNPKIWDVAGTRRGNELDKALVDGAFWKEYILWDRGMPNEDHLKACPVLKSILEQIPDATYCWFSQIHFSVLGPRTRLKPHCGGTNYRLTAHLGLTIPDGDVGIRVAGQRGSWEEGKVLVFDDSYEHEVWNGSDQPRAVLLINFWHPAIPSEKRLNIVQGMLSGIDSAIAAGERERPLKADL